MTEKKFDLEERTLEFSKAIIDLLNLLPKNTINLTLGAQVIRSGTSVGANYREANDALGKKDFALKVKTCRKEAKETVYWMDLLIKNNPVFENKVAPLLDEASQLVKIFSSIILKSV